MARWKKIAVGGTSVIFLIAAGWGLRLWALYPKAPDPSKLDTKDAVAFMASDKFSKLFEYHRKQFAMAMVEKLREKPFEELVGLMMDQSDSDQRRQAVKNMRAVPGHDEVGSRMSEIFLEKFYDLPELKRSIYLTTFVLAQRGQMKDHPNRFNLPDEERFKKDMGKFMASRTPRTQAMSGQFMMDLRRQREAMGIKEPIMRKPGN